MITASHLPYNRQGFKFFDNKAGFEKKEITDLLKRAAQDAAKGDMTDVSGFPRDKSQKEKDAIELLQNSLSIDSSLVNKVLSFTQVSDQPTDFLTCRRSTYYTKTDNDMQTLFQYQEHFLATSSLNDEKWSYNGLHLQYAWKYIGNSALGLGVPEL